MAISASDVIPLSHARANFSELAEDVRAGERCEHQADPPREHGKQVQDIF